MGGWREGVWEGGGKEDERVEGRSVGGWSEGVWEGLGK